MEELNEYGLICVAGAIALWMLIAFGLIPTGYKYLMLTSKIEQFKDRKLILTVGAIGKRRRVLRAAKIYRVFKVIYHILHREQVGLLPLMKVLLEETFGLVASRRKQIHVSQLDDVLRLLGIRLNDDELRVFAYYCEPAEGEFIEFQNFRNAVRQILTAFDMRPDHITQDILRNYLENQDFDATLNMNQLAEFMNDFNWHFEDQDIVDFLNECRFIEENERIYVADLANQLRVDLEGMPT